MSTATLATPVAATARSRLRLAWPSLVETLLAGLVVVLIAPWFARFADEGVVRDDRFALAAPASSATMGAPPVATAIAPAAASSAVTRIDSAPQKNTAMRELLASAGWQWAAWIAAALVLVKLSRTSMAPRVGVALACLLWAVAAWLGNVPWPLAQDGAFELARPTGRWDAWPARYVMILAAVGALLLAFPGGWRTRSRPQTLSTRIGYPGLVAATGVGWLLLLDLSVHGPQANRYLALYHHGHLWLALLVLTGVAFLRGSIGRALATLLAFADEIGGRVARVLGPVLAPLTLAVLVLGVTVATAVLLTGIRQVTSEIGRIWLIVGVAWFFFLRGAPIGGRVARARRRLVSLARYAWPLAFVAVVLAGMMIATRDMGPLLIAAYAAGAFFAATIAMWWHARTGAGVAPAVAAIALFAGWIAAITVALFRFGALDAVTAGRLENLAAPLASANDQLALVAWFRNAAPAHGFGWGNVPWCGYASAGACAGVPAQIQSDYTFTALVGVFGWWPAWAIALGCALWLHRLVRHHGRVTRGEPRFVVHRGRIEADRQAFVSWVAVAWVVLALCQLGVTVAGNLGVLPLTGVTFPFVSFGMTSLVVNAAFLALCLTMDVPADADG